MIRICVICFIAFLLPSFVISQTKNLDCKDVKKGIFYLYPSSLQKGFIILRNDSIQKEINIETKDTSFWKINWKDDCICNLKFIRSTQIMPDEEKEFYNLHQPVINILGVTKNYYIFKVGLDSINAAKTITDTIWFRARNPHN